MDNWLAIIIAPIATLLAVVIERTFNAHAQKEQKSFEIKEGYNRLAIDLLREEIAPILAMTDAIAHTIEKIDALDLDIRTLIDLNEGGKLDAEIDEKIDAIHEVVLSAEASYNSAIIRAGSLSGDLLDSALSLYQNYSEILRLLLSEKKTTEYKDWVEDYREKSAELLVDCSELRKSCREFILNEKSAL